MNLDFSNFKKIFTLVCFTIPVFFIIRIIRPFIRIRFGSLASHRIGHLALDMELARCIRSKTIRTINFPFYLDVFLYSGKISNPYLLNLWKKSEIITNSYSLNQLHYLNQRIGKTNAHNCLDFVEREGHWDLRSLDKVKEYMQIPLRDLENGWEELSKFGLKHGSRFVCLCVRDDMYLKSQYPDQDWTYHNYRDTKIEDYLDAAETLAGMGYFVFRMGQTVKSRLISENSRVIDYANSSLRSEFLDIFLLANSSFTISTSTGPDNVSAIFRRPIGLINTVQAKSVSLGNIHRLYQPKFFKSIYTGKYLGVEELLESNWHKMNSAKELEDKGLEVVDNSPVEIKEFVIEFEKMTNQKEILYTNNTLKDNLLRKISETWIENLKKRNSKIS